MVFLISEVLGYPERLPQEGYIRGNPTEIISADHPQVVGLEKGR